MKTLFINESLIAGGIETFMVRLAANNVSDQVKINFLLLKRNYDAELYQQLCQYSNVYFWDDFVYFPKSITNKLPSVLKMLLPIKKQKFINEILIDLNHIHVPDTNALFFLSRFSNLAKDMKISFSLGIYHINEYNFLKYKKVYFIRKLIGFIKSVESKNFLFFNEISRDTYSELYKLDSNESYLAPIGIELKNAKNNCVGKKNVRIVSVGRLSPWKTYNYHMIDVIDKWNNEEYKIYYENYGDGVERDKLEQKVKELNLEERIKFYPSIKYSDFSKTISDSLLFIGAGTALIEASAEGIPALIGIENHDKTDPKTYGFLHDFTTYSYQEKELKYEMKDISFYILKLLNMTTDQYEAECKLAKKRAEDFGINKTVKVFNELVLESKILVKGFTYFELFRIFLSMSIYRFLNRNKTNNFFKRL